MIDKTVHDFVKIIPGIPWEDFHKVGVDEDYFDYYYAEAEQYVIRDRISTQLFFVKARSPKEAMEKLKEIFRDVAMAMAGEDAIYE